MRDRGQSVKKGTLSEDGDLEFWEDGTTTTRTKSDDAVPQTDGPKSVE
jgi:protein import protein ZIM17